MNIRRSLDTNYGYAIIRLKMGAENIPVDAVLDTGAAGNLIRKDLIDLLKLTSYKDIGITTQISGNTLSPCFEAKFKVEKCENIFIETFVQMPFDSTYNLVLGTPFLKRCKSFTYMGGKDLWFQLEL